MTKIGTKKEYMQHLIATNNWMVEWALQVLLARQTADEKACKDTVELNGRGFNAQDAGFLTDLAEGTIKKVAYKPGDRLTHKQRQYARKLLPKYHRQLVEVADAKFPKWYPSGYNAEVKDPAVTVLSHGCEMGQ